MSAVVRALLFAVLFVAQPARAQPTAEIAIQELIVRSNAAQAQTFSARGVSSIELVNIEWGPISVLGSTATATTFETWRTSYTAGPTEFARDRNVYSLELDNDGAWRIVANTHPDGRQPMDMSRTPPESDSDIEVEVPAGQGTSRNWSGYAARGGEFTSISGTWVVPEVAIDSPFGADAAWVGIGGYRTRDLIQAGTQSMSSGSGRVTYQAWYEKLPDFSHPVPLTILPGHTVNVSIDQQATDVWLITITNVTTGEVHRRNEDYVSTRSSAEWIQEAPFARRRILPLSQFGSITFTTGSAIRDGQALSIADLGGRAIALVDQTGRALAVPSALGPDGQSFSVARSP